MDTKYLYNTYLENIGNKKIVLFGASTCGLNFIETCSEYVGKEISYVRDNNKNLWMI